MRNLPINMRAVAGVRYRAPIVGWEFAELEELDWNIGKTLQKYNVVHPKENVLTSYLPQKEERGGLIGAEECVASNKRV